MAKTMRSKTMKRHHKGKSMKHHRKGKGKSMKHHRKGKGKSMKHHRKGKGKSMKHHKKTKKHHKRKVQKGGMLSVLKEALVPLIFTGSVMKLKKKKGKK
jgi:hypothetical protein